MSQTRRVDAALLAYMQGNGLHMAKATKVGPLPDGTFRYFTDTTRNRTFDHGDGRGPQVHYASSGAILSQLVSTAGMGVDNAEATSLSVSGGAYLKGFTDAQVKAGELDAVPYETRCFCYTDPDLGSFVWAAGRMGDVRIDGTAIINFEMTSLSKLLRQVIGEVDSTRCRAPFGSQPFGTGVSSGATEALFPCGFDLSTLWLPTEVTSVHPDDVDLIFFDTGLAAYANGYFDYGMVRGITGANAGIEREVDHSSTDGIEGMVRLAFPLPYNPEVGDTFEIRKGCDHTDSALTGCRFFFGSEWTGHYRGEPRQPIADAAGNMISGAFAPGEIGGTGEPQTPAPPPPPGTGGGSGNGSNSLAPVRTRGATILNVLDYGAVGNGVTYDTGAINSAINDLPGDGGTVYLPGPKTYLVDTDTSIKPRSNMRLLLASDAIIQGDYTAVDHRYAVYINGKTEVEVEGGTIRGYKDAWSPLVGTTSEWGHGIAVLGGSTSVTIRDTTIEKCVGDAISVGRESSDVWIDNCYLTNCRRQGVSNGGDDVHITNCEISYISGTSPESGIDIESDNGASAEVVEISGNHIHHCDGPCVTLWQRSTDVDVTDNTLELSSYGVLANDSEPGTITGNTIRHNRNWGIRFQNGSTGYAVNSNVFFNNRTVDHGFVTYDESDLTTRTGTSTYTSDHIHLDSGTTATVGTNEFGP